MKNSTLLALLLATTLSFANSKENIDTTPLSKQQKVEITKSTTKTLFFWEVNTTTGYASGYTFSKDKALKTIKLMGTSDVITYRIVESYKNK